MARAALLLVAAAVSGVVAQDHCIANFGNSTFNLREFRAQLFYRVQDASNNPGSRNYSYFFNICRNVDPMNLPGTAGGGANPQAASLACNTTTAGTGRGGQALTGPAMAFQVNNLPAPQADLCHRLGGAAGPNTVSWGLYDPTNPSRGVALQYTGGDACPRGTSRSLKLWIMCDIDATNVPDEELVAETSGCAYEIFVRSAYGCPAECPITVDPNTGTKNLCSRHGICEYDTAIGNSRCFCNDGWTGGDCSSPVTAPAGGLSAVGGVLIAVGIFLALTLGFLVYLWMRIRSLRLDPAAYSTLRSGDEPVDNTVQ